MHVRARAALLRLLLFTALWWVLAEGEAKGWAVAAASVGGATLASLILLPPGSRRLRVAALARFVPFFLRESVRGGIDVARRALHPRLPLSPGFIEYRLRLPAGPARVLFATTISLLPGTVSAQLGETHLRVHLLDRSRPVQARLRELEERVASVFGIELPANRRAQ
jgi:multicomponent Na+:H+ antiporter subunit E